MRKRQFQNAENADKIMKNEVILRFRMSLKERDILRATLVRILSYLKYLKNLSPEIQNISAMTISN